MHKQLSEEETTCPWKKLPQVRAERKLSTSVTSAPVLLRQLTFPRLDLHRLPPVLPNSTLLFFFFFLFS